MKKNLFNKFWLRGGMLVAILCTLFAGTVKADEEYTIGWGTATGAEGTYKNFTNTSGTVENILSFTTAQNQSATPPAYNSNNNDLRLYYHSGGNGGSITLTPASGITFTGFVMTTSTTPSVKYTVDNGSATSVSATNNGTTYSVTGISATSSLKIQNVNTTNVKLFIKTIKITYTTSGSTPTTYTVTYDANGGSGTMTDADSPYESGATVTVLDNDFTRAGYDFVNWNTAADGSGTDYDADDTFTISANTTLYAQWEEQSGDAQWVLTSLSALTASDVFVIVGNNGSNYALSSANGTSSAPPVASVTIESNQITSTVENTIKWTISGNATDGYIFHPNGDTKKYIYCTNANNGVRVGTPNSGTTEIHAFTITGGYLTAGFATPRYVGIYNSQDWRCYNSYTSGNIANQTFAFYKKVTGGVIPPSITASNIEIAYDAPSGSIEYTLTNEVTGGVLSAEITGGNEGNWLSLGTVGATVPFTCTANGTATERTAQVTLTYTYNTNETVTKTITVTQAGNPNAVDNISDITAAGTYKVRGTIVAKSLRGFIVGDGTGYVYYYNQNYPVSNYNIGDKVKLEGSVKVYGGVYEFDDETTITAATESNYVAEDPTVLTGSQMDTRVESTTPAQLSTYVQYEGKFSVNDTHYNITNIDGASTAIGSISYPLNATALTGFDGKIVKVTGYYVGISSSTYYNTLIGSIEAVTTPVLSVTPAETNVGFEATNGTLNVIPTNFSLDDVEEDDFQYFESDGSTSSEQPEWLTVSYNDETKKINYSVTANDGETRSAYFKLVLCCNEEYIYSDIITINQEAYVAPASGKYVKVTSTDDLTDGQYLIVYEEGSVAFDGGLETLDAVGNTIEVTISNNEIAADATTNAAEFTIDVTAGTILSASGSYIGQNSNANGMQTSDETEYKNTISISDGDADIVSSGGAYLRYNSASNQTRFRYYKSSSYTGQQAIQLYKKVEAPITVTVGDALYTTYVAPVAVSFPDDVIAYIVTSKTETAVTLTEKASVPAGTPVVVKATEAGTYALTTTTTPESVDGNLLLASDGNVQGGEGIYALSTLTGTAPVGFYPVSSDIKVPARKAYLYISGGNVKGYTFDFDDDATGISSVESFTEEGAIYNLAGQRLQKMQRGINIVGGKKVLK